MDEHTILLNGRTIQVTYWSGREVPPGWVPLDGRTVEGITLPDHRANFVYESSGKTMLDDPNPPVCIFWHIVRLHDLVAGGKTKIMGVMP